MRQLSNQSRLQLKPVSVRLKYDITRAQAVPFLPMVKFSTMHSPFSSTMSASSSMEGMV